MNGDNKSNIRIVLIGAIASIAVTNITAGNTPSNISKNTTEKVENVKDSILEEVRKLTVVTGGEVNKNGKKINSVGIPFDVEVIQNGQYRIKFKKPFRQKPIVVAIGDGGDKGAYTEITNINNKGFVLEGRDYLKHGLAQLNFQFLVVGPETNISSD